MERAQLASADRALLTIAEALRAAQYEFVTVTPDTHRRVNLRAMQAGAGLAQNLRDVFGWNRRFERKIVPDAVLEALRAAEAVTEDSDGLLLSRVRFASLRGALYLHSAFPTDERSAVFFGPDTYRFCSLVARHVVPGKRTVDVGCGTGAGGLTAAAGGARAVLVDINEEALRYARINAHLAGVEIESATSDVLAGVSGDIGCVVANPPYMLDDQARTYRDGGGSFGEGLAVRIVREAMARLSPGGSLVLYTGAAIVDGIDTCLHSLQPLLDEAGAAFSYEEIDPDVFGEELERPSYARVERIAAVALVAKRR